MISTTTTNVFNFFKISITVVCVLDGFGVVACLFETGKQKISFELVGRGGGTGTAGGNFWIFFHDLITIDFAHHI